MTKSDEAHRLMIHLAYDEIERAKLETRLIANSNSIMKDLPFVRQPDEHGHVWDGAVVVIHTALLQECSRCGCDPSEDRARWECRNVSLSNRGNS